MSKIRTTRDVVLHALQFIHGEVLDAGGGTAKYKATVSGAATRYVCLDMNPGNGVDIVGDILNMPFEDSSFDSVICNQVLEHVPDPEKLLQEVFRVLRSGGHAIITAPFMQPVHADPGDFFRYTPEGISAIAQRYGFHIVERGKYGGVWALVSSFLKFSLFDPYKKQNRLKNTIFRRLHSGLIWLDQWTHPKKFFSDSFAILRKP